MKNLLLMRHAKSSWNDPYLADHDRPLNSRGKSDAPRMGKFVASIECVPEVILCSTAKRAKQTVEYFLQECPLEGEVIYKQSLYHGGAEDFINELVHLDTALMNVMIVGHNPGMEDAIEEFCGANEHMPTASIAHIKLDLEKWEEINENSSGDLENLWRPREI